MIPKTKYTDPQELQPKRIKIDNEKGVHSTETWVVDCPGVDLARKMEKDWRRYTASLKDAKRSLVWALSAPQKLQPSHFSHLMPLCV